MFRVLNPHPWSLAIHRKWSKLWSSGKKLLWYLPNRCKCGCFFSARFAQLWTRVRNDLGEARDKSREPQSGSRKICHCLTKVHFSWMQEHFFRHDPILCACHLMPKLSDLKTFNFVNRGPGLSDSILYIYNGIIFPSLNHANHTQFIGPWIELTWSVQFYRAKPERRHSDFIRLNQNVTKKFRRIDILYLLKWGHC